MIQDSTAIAIVNIWPGVSRALGQLLSIDLSFYNDSPEPRLRTWRLVKNLRPYVIICPK